MTEPVSASNICDFSLPKSGGIGLKPAHYAELLALGKADSSDSGEVDRRDVGSEIVRPAWLELHPQNYFGKGGAAHRWLAALADCYPIGFHSVGLSLGSASGLNLDQLDRLAELCAIYRPAIVSDHLSWSGDDAHRYPALLPMPYNRCSLDHLAEQIDRAQTRLKRCIAIENPARMLGFAADKMDEVDFLHRLCARSGCKILLDINNIEVSCTNLRLDMTDYLDRIDPALVVEIHLAGHRREDHPSGPLLIDDHGGPVSETSWALLARFIAGAGPRPLLIEWDVNPPNLPILSAEMARANRIMAEMSAETGIGVNHKDAVSHKDKAGCSG